MTKQQIRSSIIEIIDQIEDEEVLENCYELLNSVLHLQDNNIVAYTPDGEALDSTQYEAEILQTLLESEQGGRITHERIKMNQKHTAI